MPHEPLTGDALLDALAEVPGDPAEPVARVASPRKQPDPPPESEALIIDPIEEENPE